MSTYRIFSCVVGRGCLLWPSAFSWQNAVDLCLLHFVLQGQICLLLQESLDFLLLHSSPKRTSFLAVSSRRFCVHQDPGERSIDPTRDWSRLAHFDWSHGSRPCLTQWKNYEPCCVGPPKMDRFMVESSDKMWSTRKGNGKALQYSCLENPMNSMMFTTALFTIGKTWKQPKYLLTEEWIKKKWYIYSMVYWWWFSL